MTRVPSEPLARALRTNRRWVIGSSPWQEIEAAIERGVRVILDNDFSGDPDDLYQLVHHLLSPSADIRAVIASHLRDDDPFDPGPATTARAEAVVRPTT